MRIKGERALRTIRQGRHSEVDDDASVPERDYIAMYCNEWFICADPEDPASGLTFEIGIKGHLNAATM
jgi:hypothetical protein